MPPPDFHLIFLKERRKDGIPLPIPIMFDESEG
jgi:hypothetical protein